MAPKHRPAFFTAPGLAGGLPARIWPGALENLSSGRNCIASACTGSHERPDPDHRGTIHMPALNAFDTLGLPCVSLRRIEALLLPFKTLVGGGL